jgi:hypothetical protein
LAAAALSKLANTEDTGEIVGSIAWGLGTTGEIKDELL